MSEDLLSSRGVSIKMDVSPQKPPKGDGTLFI